MSWIHPSNLTPLQYQALRLGVATGGGGDTLLGEITAEALVAKAASVDLISLEDLDDNALIAAVGGVGIVLLAIILDRITQALGSQEKKKTTQRWFETGPVGLLYQLFRR